MVLNARIKAFWYKIYFENNSLNYQNYNLRKIHIRISFQNLSKSQELKSINTAFITCFSLEFSQINGEKVETRQIYHIKSYVHEM